MPVVRLFGTRVIHIMRVLTQSIIDVLFPIACVGCSKSGIVLCTPCARAIPAPEYSETLIAPWSFRDPRARALIHHLKYRKRTVVTVVCAEALAEKLVEVVSEKQLYGTFENPLLVPIPLHPSRARSRGYNQAALLARALEKTALFPSTYEPNVLKRIKDTPAQARIKDKRERLRNIVGAFAVDRRSADRIAGADIVLIDDVATTGATLREAARVLKEAGAREILLCAVAH